MTTTSIDTELFERIVQEVIRRLVERGVEVGQQSTCELQVPERVVTMAALQGKLTGVGSVVVRQDAIVTPAVKDDLKEKRINLVKSGKRPATNDKGP